VLEQTYEDLELIISDNASSDSTGEICREAAAQDPRVRYYRVEVNRGLAWNHNRALQLARGRYSMWLGHDDLLGKDYIRRCLDALEQDSGAVLSYTYSNYIDKQGTLLRRIEHQNDCDSHSPHERFGKIIELHHLCDAVFGLMRTDVVKQTRGHLAFPDSDRVLLAEMGLRGRFIVIPAFSFSRRMHNASVCCSSARYPSAQERALFFTPVKASRIALSSRKGPSIPFVRECATLFSAINRAPLPWAERYNCYKRLYWWLRVHRTLISQDVLSGFRL
jgi:glycosyltransferase involved in cell wall biosynthesis